MTEEQGNAYLERIKFSGEARLTSAVLDALIRAHIGSVPFENIDVYDFDRIPSLEEADLFRKIVENRRGGYCFELNTLFHTLLDFLGFDSYAVMVRIIQEDGILRPFSHKGLVAAAEGKKWYADVGFGGPGPKGIIELCEGEQEVSGIAYRFVKRKWDFLLQRRDAGSWIDVLSFADRPAEPCDFLPLNFYLAKEPDSYFRANRIVNLTLPEGSKALTGMHFTLRKNGEVIEKDLDGPEELRQLLREEYGLE